jgi:hypothetical protein
MSTKRDLVEEQILATVDLKDIFVAALHLMHKQYGDEEDITPPSDEVADFIETLDYNRLHKFQVVATPRKRSEENDHDATTTNLER